jgi:DNA-binding transcriptional regulator GbsR (MarR family)
MAEKDVWTITTTIIEERRKREIKPVQRALGEVVGDLRQGGELPPADVALADRIEALVEIIEVFEGFSEALLPLLRGRSLKQVRRVAQFAAKLQRGRADDDSDGS